MNSILLILNVGLVLTCAACLLAGTHLRSRPAYLIGLYVLSYADVVIILECAGLLSAIEPSVVLALQFLLTALSVLAWLRAGKPSLLGPFSGLKMTRLGFADILTEARKSPLSTSLVVLLACSVGYVYARHAQLILVVPPDNWDSLTYHLSRVGYWLQYKSLQPWPTPNLRQTSWPMNAELGLLWTILWWGTDQLAGFVQWITVPIIMLGIYGLVRLLGYSRWQGAVTALLWATVTQVLVQSSTTQNDLVATSFWVAAFYFFLTGVRENKRVHFCLSGIAFGLAVGAKSTSLIALPGLGFAVTTVFFLRRKHAQFQIKVLRWAIACLLGFLFLGSYVYIQNSLDFGSPLGPFSFQKDYIVLDRETAMAAYAHRLRDNLARYTYQLVDFSTLPFGLASKINPLKAAVFAPIFDRLGIAIQNPETTDATTHFSLDYINGVGGDTSWYGPLSAVLMVAVVYQGFQAIRRGDSGRLALAVAPLGFLAFQSATMLWMPFSGRFYNIPVAVSFPLIAGFLQPRPAWRAALTCVLVLLGLSTMLVVSQNNGALQSLGRNNPFATARVAPSWASEFNYRMITENVPVLASIGIDSQSDFRDYPFFGEQFTRRVTLAIPADESILPRVDTGPFIQDFQDSDFLFLVSGGSPFSRGLASSKYRLLSVHDGNALWMRNDPRAPEACEGDKWPFTDFFKSSSASVCPQFPIIPGTIANGFVQSSFLSTGQFVPVIGTGSNALFEFGLLVKRESSVGFSIQAQSRYTRDPQTLLMAISGAGSDPKSFSAPFRAEQTLNFAVPLPAGSYRIQLGLASGEQASINRFQVTTP